jgi:hypothetical protein
MWYNIDSDRNVGLAPLVTTFHSLKQMSIYRWWFGGTSDWTSPDWVYWHWEPPCGKPFYTPRLGGPVSDNKFVDFIRVYEPGGPGHLKVKEASPAPKLGWDNAIDGDTYWYNGTDSVGKDETGNAWAIFEFTDEGTRSITKIRMMNDTGIGKLENQATAFKMMVSTDGETFTQVLEAEKTNNVNMTAGTYMELKRMVLIK